MSGASTRAGHAVGAAVVKSKSSSRPQRIRRTAVIALAAGVIVFAVVIARVGVGAITDSMRALGWPGFAATVAFHLVPILLTGFAWWVLARSRADGRARCFVWGRLIRDSAGEVLPFSQVGGFVFGARAAALCGVPGTFAAASTIVDVTVELGARVPYLLLGLLLLVWLKPDSTLAMPMLAGAGVMLALAAAFVAVQGRAAALLDRIGTVLVPQWAGERSAGGGPLQDTMRAIYARHPALWLALLLHLAAWVLSGAEVALTMWLMGSPIGLAEGIAIDCLVSAVRSAAFMVPNAVGVQEGAYLLACGLFGLGPDVAVALSLLRRGRDIALALPALAGWQMLEGRKAWRGLAVTEAATLRPAVSDVAVRAPSDRTG